MCCGGDIVSDSMDGLEAAQYNLPQMFSVCCHIHHGDDQYLHNVASVYAST